MTSAPVESTSDRPVAPFAVGAVGSLAILVAVLHCAAAALASGYWFDEVYLLAIGRYRGHPGIAVQLLLAAGVLGVALGGYGLWRLFRSGDVRQ